MLIHSRYNVPPKRVVECSDPSLTQQHFKDEADINNIIARYTQTGFLVDPLTPATAGFEFGDFANVPDFLSAQNVIANATQAFAMLPANVRKRFGNDPVEMLVFLEDINNREEAERLGIVAKSIQESSVVNSVKPDPAATSTKS